MQEHNINFFSSSKSKFYECASVKIKIKRKRKEKKIGDIDFRISVLSLGSLPRAEHNFLRKESKDLTRTRILSNQCLCEKINIHLMFNFVGLRLICLDINFLPC